MTMDEVLARLRALEDRAEISELIARYGPHVDAGEGEGLGELWAAGGAYRVGNEYEFRGDEIGSLTEISEHRALMARGCGHMLSAPTITVTGDTAVAINHSVVIARDGDGWTVERLSANRWSFARTSEGWRVMLRENALLDGDEGARALLRFGRE